MSCLHASPKCTAANYKINNKICFGRRNELDLQKTRRHTARCIRARAMHSRQVKHRDTGRNNVNLFSRRNNHVPLFTVLKNNNTMSMLQSILRSASVCVRRARGECIEPKCIIVALQFAAMFEIKYVAYGRQKARRDVTTENSLGNADRIVVLCCCWNLMPNSIVDSPANIEFACYHMESTMNSIECKNCPLFSAVESAFERKVSDKASVLRCDEVMQTMNTNLCRCIIVAVAERTPWEQANKFVGDFGVLANPKSSTKLFWVNTFSRWMNATRTTLSTEILTKCASVRFTLSVFLFNKRAHT